MKGTKTVIHYGAPGQRRHEALFERAIEGFDPLSLETLYLVASHERREQLRARFLEQAPEAFELPFMTFPDLVRRLSAAEPPVSRKIDLDLKESLLEDIVVDGFTVGHPDFRAGSLPYVSQFIAFIKSQNISDPEMLELRYKKSRRQPSPLEWELIRIFGRYQAVLKAGRMEDEEDEQARVYTALLTGALDPARVFTGLRRLVLEGFYRLTPLQAGIVHHILESVEEADFSIGGLQTPQLDPDRPEWEFLDRPGLEWVHHPVAPMAKACFARPESREEEVSIVAARIEGLRREDPGLRLREVAIVCASTERYRPILEDVFGDIGLPLRFVGGKPASESMAAGLFLKYLRLVEEDFSSVALFDFLLHPRLRVGLSAETIQRLERIAKKSGVSSGFQTWNEEFGPFVRRYAESVRDESPEAATRLEEATGRFLEILATLRPDPQTQLSPTQWRLQTADRLAACWPLFDAEQRRAACSDTGLFHEFWARLAAICAEFPPQRVFSFREFKSLSEKQFERCRGRLDPGEDGVLVATPTDLQQTDFRHVFWVGLAEGEFPDRPGQHIFFDDVRSSQWGFTTWEDRLRESHWLFESLTASARESLFLSCPLKAGDSVVSTSVFWEDSRSRGDFTDRSGLTRQVGRLDFPLAPAAIENVRRGGSVQRLRETGPYSSFQGFFADPKMVARLREEIVGDSFELSPSQLESYIRCGFRYFVQRVAGIDPLEEESNEITPLERGNLIHSVLFRFVNGMDAPSDFAEAARLSWVGRQKRRMHDALQRELARLRLEKRWRDELFWAHEEKLLSAGLLGEEGHGVLAEFVDQQWERLRTHRIEAVEVRVGPVELGTLADVQGSRLAPVRLRGKIDRLDSGPHGLTVIDYKTGQDQLPRVYQGWGFQLPLYRFMARRAQDRPVEGAAFYLVQVPDEVKLREISAETGDGDPKSGLDALEEYYKKKAIQAARLLFDGRFPVTLLGPSNAGCRVCDYRHVCRFDASEMESVRRSGNFPIDEPIVQRGRWIQAEAGATERSKPQSREWT